MSPSKVAKAGTTDSNLFRSTKYSEAFFSGTQDEEVVEDDFSRVLDVLAAKVGVVKLKNNKRMVETTRP
jgi:hypothetical protein